MQSEIEFELNENGYQSGQSSNFYVLFQSALGFFRLLCLTVELNAYTPTRNVGEPSCFTGQPVFGRILSLPAGLAWF